MCDMIQMKEDRIDYFPIKRAISLKDKRDEEEMKLDELKLLVLSINERFAPLEELARRDHSTGVVSTVSDN